MKQGLAILAAALTLCGAAAAAVELRTVTLQPGSCVKASKALRVCAAPASTSTVTVTVTTAAPVKTSFSDGVYRVGADIQPGTYRTTGAPQGCYWARLSGFSGSLDDIIENDIGNGQAVATISASDAGFKSSGCGGWTKTG